MTAISPAPAVHPGWRAVGATVQGVSHRQQSIPCQDSCHWEELPGGILIAAAADGCGSAKHAALGAEWATQAALDQLAQSLTAGKPAASEWEPLLRRAMQWARDAVLSQAEDLGVEPAQLASTLLIAALHMDCLAAAQIGDGAIVARISDQPSENRLIAVTKPAAGEYINETVFVTSDASLERAQIVVQPGPITGLAMFTDGLQMLALQMPQGTPHERFFLPMFDTVANAPSEKPITPDQLKAFLQSPRVSERTHDDLLLLLAVPETSPPKQPQRRGRQTIHAPSMHTELHPSMSDIPEDRQ